MAVIQPTIKDRGQFGEAIVTWANLANGDTGEWVNEGGYAVASIDVRGTFGASGNVQFQTDLSEDGSAVTGITNSTTAGRTGYTNLNLLAGRVRPNVTAGDGTTLLTFRAQCVRVAPKGGP